MPDADHRGHERLGEWCPGVPVRAVTDMPALIVKPVNCDLEVRLAGDAAELAADYVRGQLQQGADDARVCVDLVVARGDLQTVAVSRSGAHPLHADSREPIGQL